MSIGVSKFDPLSFDEANPELVGAQHMNALLGQILQNQSQATANRFQAPTLQAALTQEQAKAQYAPQMTLAELLAKQEEAPYKEAQIQEILKGTIPLNQAQAGLFNAETKFMPLKYASEAAANARAGSRFGDAYQFARILQSLPEKQRADYITANPEAMQNLQNTLGNKALQQQVSYPQQLVDTLLRKQFGNILPEEPGASGQGSQSSDYSRQQIATLADALNGNYPKQPQPTQPTQPTPQASGVEGSTFGSGGAQQAADITTQMQHSQNLMKADSQTKKRAGAVIAFESTMFKPEVMAQYVPRINNALQYAGMIGAGKNITDTWLNQHQGAKEDYDWYQNTFGTLANNGIKYLENMGATDEASKTAKTMVDVIDKPSSNPERARVAINRLMSTIQDFGDGVINSAEPGTKGTYRKTSGIPRLQGDYLDYKPDQSGSVSKSIGNKTYKKINGKWYEL